MKVKELIALLVGLPHEAEIFIGSDLGLGELDTVEIIVVTDRPNPRFKDGKYVDYANVDDHPSTLRDAVLIQ